MNIDYNQSNLQIVTNPLHLNNNPAQPDILNPTADTSLSRCEESEEIFLGAILEQLEIPADDQSAIQNIFEKQGFEEAFNLLQENFSNHIQSCKYLNLKNLNLKTIPEEIGFFTKLKTIHMQKNLLCYLPASILFLDELQVLNLSHNEFTSIPESINLSKIYYLYMSVNKITNLPTETFNGIRISLDNNKITEIPSSFLNPSTLIRLYIGNNQLKSLPDNFPNLSELKTVNLSNNQITSLPDDFGNLEKLQNLQAQGNQLKSLPDNFPNLSELKTVNLYNNQITSLPDDFGNLKKLKKISIQGNKLSELPQSMENLTSLVNLDISGNCFQSRPTVLDKLPHTHVLDSRNFYSYNQYLDRNGGRRIKQQNANNKPITPPAQPLNPSSNQFYILPQRGPQPYAPPIDLREQNDKTHFTNYPTQPPIQERHTHIDPTHSPEKPTDKLLDTLNRDVNNRRKRTLSAMNGEGDSNPPEPSYKKPRIDDTPDLPNSAVFDNFFNEKTEDTDPLGWIEV